MRVRGSNGVNLTPCVEDPIKGTFIFVCNQVSKKKIYLS